jgi:hypothetical protein
MIGERHHREGCDRIKGREKENPQFGYMKNTEVGEMRRGEEIEKKRTVAERNWTEQHS